MILLLFSSIHRFLNWISLNFFTCFFTLLFSAHRLLIGDTFFLLFQDDAIRNLFSAKTMHEFSARSLLTFLVLHSLLAVLNFARTGCFLAIFIHIVIKIKLFFFSVQKIKLLYASYWLVGMSDFYVNF